MACNKCYNNSCNGSCNKSSISRQIRINNNSQTFITGVAKIEFDTLEELRNMDLSIIESIYSGNITNIQLNGYYEKNDTPAPIQYYLSNSSRSDDGGSLLEIGSIKLEHYFKGNIDVRYFGTKGDGITDDLIPLQNVFNYVKFFEGNKEITIPETDSFYNISDTLFLQTSNLIINWNGNLKLSKSENPLALYIAAKAYDTAINVDEALYNITIRGNGSYIDGNGLGSTSPEFGVYNSTIRAIEVHNLSIYNLKIQNGARHNLILNFCRSFWIKDCIAENSRSYNGFTSFGTPRVDTPYSPSNSNSWNNGYFVDCISRNGTDYGFTSQESVNVQFVNCQVFNHEFGFSAEAAYTQVNRIMYTKFINCKAYDITDGKAFFLQARGTVVDSCYVENVANGGATTDATYRSIGGLGAYVLIGDTEIRNTEFVNCNSWGVSFVMSSGVNSNFKLDNIIIRNSVQRGGISAVGIGDNWNFNRILINNVAYNGLILQNPTGFNQNGGSINITNFEANGTDRSAIRISEVKLINLDGIYFSNVLRNFSPDLARVVWLSPSTTSPGSRVIVDNVKGRNDTLISSSTALFISTYENSYVNNISVDNFTTGLTNNSITKIKTQQELYADSLLGNINNDRNLTNRISVNDSDYTINQPDQLISINSLTSNRIITLPLASNFTARTVEIASQYTGTAFTATILPQGGSTINGESSFIINKPRQVVKMYSNGANWYILNSSIPIHKIPYINPATATAQQLTQALIDNNYILPS